MKRLPGGGLDCFMRGVLFTELIEMMEDLMGLEFTNRVIEEAQLENEGAYTAVGSYPYHELIKLLDILSSYARNPQHKVVKSYGEYLFYRSCEAYGEEMKNFKNTFSLLHEIPHILVKEIRKLEPAASVPEIQIKAAGHNCMKITYTSKKSMSHLLEGLITASIDYFQEPIVFERIDHDPEGVKVTFVLLKETGHERN